MLLKQINDMKLNTKLPFTGTLSTTTHTPSPSPPLPPTPPSIFMPTLTSSLTTRLALSPSNYLPDAVGTTFSTVSGVTTPSVNQWDCYRAQQYYKIMKHKDPPYLLVMANGIINPKTGFSFTYDGEPFTSYYKKNEFKVGNNHLRCEILQRAQLIPNWVGSRRSTNNEPPKTASWSKEMGGVAIKESDQKWSEVEGVNIMSHQKRHHGPTKCVERLSNNPINNDEDCQYIVDTVLK